MDALKKMIDKKGRVLPGNILKVDSFVNHQIDVILMKEIGRELCRRFKDSGITKVITVESSGIAPAVFAAYELGVNVVFARKRKSLTLNENLLTAEVFSYTKAEKTTITISKDYVSPDDVVLVVDDFLANGEVARGMIKLIGDAGAKLAGFGIVIEKSFQDGRKGLDEAGVRTESLVRIKSLADNKVTYLE